LFSKTQIVQKHSRLWITAGKMRVDTALQLTQDYRNIIEGLQVGSDCCSLLRFVLILEKTLAYCQLFFGPNWKLIGNIKHLKH